MRITKIEIKDFRAFYGTLEIDLHKAGKNLLVYGENGSGKSSLYLGLKLLLESSEIASTGEDTSTGFEKIRTSSSRMMATSSSISGQIQGQMSISTNGREPLKKRKTN